MGRTRTILTSDVSVLSGEGILCLHLLLGDTLDEDTLLNFEEWCYYFKATSLLITMENTSDDNINCLYRLSSMLNKEDFRFRIALVVEEPDNIRKMRLHQFVRNYSSLLSAKMFTDETSALRWLKDGF